GLTTPGTNETVTFVETSNIDLILGEATLSATSAATYGFTTIPTSPVATGNFPASVVVADFNGDGFPDVAVANYTANTVSVFAGDGLGGFTAITGSPFTVGSGPTALVVGDFNNDGRPDIPVAKPPDNKISLLLRTSGG